jgi:hypothetical protein
METFNPMSIPHRIREERLSQSISKSENGSQSHLHIRLLLGSLMAESTISGFTTGRYLSMM